MYQNQHKSMRALEEATRVFFDRSALSVQQSERAMLVVANFHAVSEEARVTAQYGGRHAVVPFPSALVRAINYHTVGTTGWARAGLASCRPPH